MINQLALEVYQNAERKGFHDGPTIIAEKLALIHSEVSEALEADRNDRYVRPVSSRIVEAVNRIKFDPTFKTQFEHDIKGTFEDECADIVIRVMGLAHLKGMNLEAHIIAKMRYNSMRSHKHGNKKY